MKLEKLSRLLSEQTNSAQNALAAKSNQAQNAVANTDSEAVALSDDLSPTDAAARADKVAKLKDAVASGTYKPDSRDVAKAIISDLLF